MSTALQIAYLPLTDALPLFVARERGLFQEFGLNVQLRPLKSWAQLRDALLLGDIDAAHCLPGIPLAAQAGLYGATAPLATALSLSHYGNAISLYRPLYDSLVTEGPLNAGLRRHALQCRDSHRPLTLASVFPVSKHEFELRHWLRAMDLDPELDLRLVVIPPPLVAQSLRDRRIDGFCVGEPWNSLTASQGIGQIVASSRSLGLPGLEKVLAVRESWLEHPDHLALIACLQSAGNWLENPANRERAMTWLGAALDLPPGILSPALLATDDGGHAAPLHIDFSGLGRPDRWIARWMLGQMQNNLAIAPLHDPRHICRRAFRCDIYDLAMEIGATPAAIRS